jgi:peroxidase
MATCNLLAAALSTTSSMAGPPLVTGFYSSTCPQAEATVRNVTEEIIRKDPTMGAAFVPLFFHDCFVRVR